ncbi:MAG: porin [Pseudomonadota bacterium]
MKCAGNWVSKLASESRWLCLTLGLVTVDSYANEEAPKGSDHLQFSGYLETYYLHDFNESSVNRRPIFTYSHNQTEKPSINLAMAKVAFKTNQLRANLALGSGSYMRANYAAEPSAFQNLFEANIGVKLLDSYDVWLDVGVMPSHIGFESAIGTENWTVTRSILADNSPYFETGARLSYTSEDGKWYASGLLLNGWQRIQRPEGNTTPSLGHQLTYKPNANITLNSSSFVGNDKSDRHRKMRYFHHFYGQYQLNDYLSLITGFDIGAEQNERGSHKYNVWFTPIVVAKYTHSDRLSFAVRAEYYRDKDAVIVDAGTTDGFGMTSYSANMDLKLSKDITLKTELRKYEGEDKYFVENNRASRDSLTATTALCVNF